MSDEKRQSRHGIAGILVSMAVAVGFMALLGCSPTKNDQSAKQPFYNDRYEKGVNDALMAFVLLNLEQQLEGTNRSFGAMSEIVCRRLKVEYRKP